MFQTTNQHNNNDNVSFNPHPRLLLLFFCWLGLPPTLTLFTCIPTSMARGWRVARGCYGNSVAKKRHIEGILIKFKMQDEMNNINGTLRLKRDFDGKLTGICKKKIMAFQWDANGISTCSIKHG